MSSLASVILCIGLVVLVVGFVANLHRFLGRTKTALREGQVLNRAIGSGIVYERTTGHRPMRHQRSGAWISEEESNYIGADGRRYRSNWLDPRTHPPIIHAAEAGVSEFSGISHFFAGLWNDMQTERQRRRRIEHKTPVQPVSHGWYLSPERASERALEGLRSDAKQQAKGYYHLRHDTYLNWR